VSVLHLKDVRLYVIIALAIKTTSLFKFEFSIKLVFYLCFFHVPFMIKNL